MLRRANKPVAALAALLIPFGAQAAEPEMPQGITPPEVMSDPNGLNLVTGKVMTQRPTISIPAAPRLTYSRASDFFMYLEGQKKISEPGTGKYSINYGGDRSEAFECESNACEAKTSGSSFTGGAVGGQYVQEKSAVRYTYNVQILNSPDFTKDIRYVTVYASHVFYPDGETLSLEYETYIPGDASAKRLKKVTSNTGYFLGFDYGLSPGSPLAVTTAAIYASANPTVPLAKFDYSTDGKQVTDMLGRTWSCSFGCGWDRGYPPYVTQEALILPGEGAAAVTYTKNAANMFLTQTITKDGIDWGYAYGGLTTQFVGPNLKSYKYSSVQVTGPNSYARSYTMRTVDHGPTVPIRYEIYGVLSSTDELGRTTNFDWDGPHYLKSMTYPEGNSAHFEYDSPGNVTKRTDKPKPGALPLPPDIVQTASYGVVHPWRIDWHKDALGRQTDYLHGSTTGQLTQQDDPADAAGVRRRTIHEYTVNNGISRRTRTRVCAAAATPLTCSGNALSRTEYTYLGNTLLPLTVTQTDEATNTSRVTAFTYDAAGRLMSEDGPRTDVNDTNLFLYDAVGRKCWELGAPDAGNLRAAKHYVYRAADDKISKVEIGTATGTGTNCTVQNFVLLEQTDTTYDSRRYPIREATSAGGTIYRVTDRSFLDRGLNECTTVRMNLAALPPTSTSACTLGTQGSQGSDRITKNLYDNAAQLLKIQRAFGTSLQQDYVTYAYTNNSKQQFVTDANGNKAQYTYDGFDRLQKWNFPSPTTAGTVSATDFEQYTYDATGNRLTLRRRDGRTLSFTYDNLNRMLSKLIPDGCPPIQPPGTGCPAASATRDVFYGYDLLGRQLTAKFDSTSGADGVTSAYDGFGNVKSSAISMGGFTKSICSAGSPCLYDADNNRTQLNFEGQTFTYTYDSRDRPTAIAELGQPAMIGFGYDSSGRPNLLSRRNARQTYFEYDPISRPNVLINTSFTSPADVRFDYGYNPASQIATQVRSNDSYAFTAIASANKAYTRNGLNQYTAVAGSTYLYDANGNLTDDGIRSYVFDAENRLVSVQNGPTLVYDPLGRMVEVSQSPYLTRFLYDGDALVGLYDASGALVRRYVHGPTAAADDPLVQYDGADLTARRFLETDHQGSVIHIGDNAGGTVATNRYDEYGVPATTNAGRFGYTGQQFMGELSMTGQPHAFYYYKARIYRADIGRFLQTDPIGYADQINLYAYVENDPVNALDPQGSAKCVGTPAQCRAYSESLTLADKSAKSRKLSARDRAEIQSVVDDIRRDASYLIIFKPKEFIDKMLKGWPGFAYTDETLDGKQYTVLPDDFGQLYDNYPQFEQYRDTNPAAERAGVVTHEGSHKQDFARNKIRPNERGSPYSPTERKADRIQDNTVKGATDICSKATGSNVCK